MKLSEKAHQLPHYLFLWNAFYNYAEGEPFFNGRISVRV